MSKKLYIKFNKKTSHYDPYVMGYERAIEYRTRKKKNIKLFLTKLPILSVNLN